MNMKRAPHAAGCMPNAPHFHVARPGRFNGDGQGGALNCHPANLVLSLYKRRYCNQGRQNFHQRIHPRSHPTIQHGGGYCSDLANIEGRPFRLKAGFQILCRCLWWAQFLARRLGVSDKQCGSSSSCMKLATDSGDSYMKLDDGGK